MLRDPISAPDEGAKPIADAPALFLANLSTIEKLIRRAAYRQSFRPDEIDDLASWVHLKLIDNDYATLRKYRGDCPLSAFLTIVILNLARDFRIRRMGKWRCSKTAERLGVEARRLEELVNRDGRSPDEAIETLVRHRQTEKTKNELEELLAQLPVKQPLTHEGGDAVDRLHSLPPELDPLEEKERRQQMIRARDALNQAIASLGAEDRLLLRLIFEDGWSIARIARHYRWEQRQLYLRRDRSLRQLRGQLEKVGVDGELAAKLLGWPKSTLDVQYEAPDRQLGIRQSPPRTPPC